ncbi:PAS domain S-box protein [Planctomycetaceae bacterium SH139]
MPGQTASPGQRLSTSLDIFFHFPRVNRLRQSNRNDVAIFATGKKQVPAEFRIHALRSDGETFPIQVSVSDYPPESRQTRIAIIRDLTEFEKAEQERITMAREPKRCEHSK